MEDYIKHLEHFKSNGAEKIYTSIDKVLDELRMAEKDGYNKALMDVLDNAEVKQTFISTGDYSGRDHHVVDEKSILKLRRN